VDYGVVEVTVPSEKPKNKSGGELSAKRPGRGLIYTSVWEGSIPRARAARRNGK